MNYVQKSFEEIFESMLEDCLSKGLISHADEFESYIKNQEDISNYYVMDKAVIAQMFQKAYEDMTKVYNIFNIDLAEGHDLDNIGKILGVPRPRATYATCNLTFTRHEVSEENNRIESGVIVSSSNGIQYRTIEEGNFLGEIQCVVPAMALKPGSKYRVIENTLKNIESQSLNLTCTNSDSSGGVDEYADDQYRELLKKTGLINLKGSREAFMNYFENFDGIDGYKLVPNWNGSGTLKIILDPGLPSQLNQAYNEIHEKNVCQIDGDIFLTAPTERFIDVYAIVNVDIDMVNPYSNNEKEQIKSKIISAIKIFIDGGYRVNGDYYPGLIIGEDFIPHKLAVFLDAEIPELKNIDFNYPTDYITILDDEKGVSKNITIEMI